jgi:cation/acetate symporter
MEILSVLLFVGFVAVVLALSFFFARRAKTASGYYAAGSSIPWPVNGIAFAGDYLSAASFLGICGMIATSGYDGFLYSIGFLAGWVVALFVVAEPMKRLGKYTFGDAIDAKYNSRGIQLSVSISTLIVFSSILVVAVCVRGLSTEPDQGGKIPFRNYRTLSVAGSGEAAPLDPAYTLAGSREINGLTFVKLVNDGRTSWWKNGADAKAGSALLLETQSVTTLGNGIRLINGTPASRENQLIPVGNMSSMRGKTGPEARTGSINPFGFLAAIEDPGSTVVLWRSVKFIDGTDKVTVYYPVPTEGSRIMRPGLRFKVEGKPLERIDFASLMLALFLGTAALPHILIRYYTVPSPAAARKSTIVAIAAIGFFYILTLFMGLGAMTNGVVNLADDNMSAPLLARYAKVITSDRQMVVVGKIVAFTVGFVAIILGIIFKGVNVSFLVGLAFAVAASSNLPAIVMNLFWKRTTAQGIVASIVVGVAGSLGIILLSPTMYEQYGLDSALAPVQLKNPGIVSIPLSFASIVFVSLITGVRRKTRLP